jgi:hypothetical protein
MSGQVNDMFQYNNIEYCVSAEEFPAAFFDICALGIKPRRFDTACQRGYIATFSINGNNQLVLNQLYTNNGNKDIFEAPLINGKLPEISTPEGMVAGFENYREYNYDAIDFAINYTGSIIITKGLIKGRNINIGFPSPISYNVVIQLTFNNGQFVSSKDLSDIAASIREKKIELTEKNIEKMGLQWIVNRFDVLWQEMNIR